jgi:hypothetical protein
VPPLSGYERGVTRERARQVIDVALRVLAGALMRLAWSASSSRARSPSAR